MSNAGISERQSGSTLDPVESSDEKLMIIKPRILYFGTPVVLVSTVDSGGSANLSPISSAWALGKNVVIGLSGSGKALENLEATGECSLNFPEKSLWEAVEKLAPLTGKNPVPPEKKGRYRYEKDKFKAAGLTPVPSEIVKPPRVLECPLQIEGVVKNIYRMDQSDVEAAIVEIEAVRVHAHRSIVMDEEHVDTGKWHPLFYVFRHYFSTGKELGRTFKAEK